MDAIRVQYVDRGSRKVADIVRPSVRRLTLHCSRDVQSLLDKAVGDWLSLGRQSAFQISKMVGFPHQQTCSSLGVERGSKTFYVTGLLFYIVQLKIHWLCVVYVGP